MIEPTTLARPYARAAFEYARSAQALGQWQDNLTLLAQVAQVPRVKAMLTDPAQTGAQRANALLALLGDDLTPALRNFVAVMAENGRLALLPDVVCLFGALKAELESTVAVSVTSAYPLEDAEAQRLRDMLSVRLNRSVTLTTHTDPTLLGGALIRAGDLVIDGSVRGRLEKLAGALTP